MISKKPNLIVDIDNTLTVHSSSKDYNNKKPRKDVIDKLISYKKMGFEIILFTARNMLTHQGDISKINKLTAPILTKWLKENKVPYDGIIYGKPWCGVGGFYVDDKAVRPSEFVNLNYEEIQKIIK